MKTKHFVFDIDGTIIEKDKTKDVYQLNKLSLSFITQLKQVLLEGNKVYFVTGRNIASTNLIKDQLTDPIFKNIVWIMNNGANYIDINGKYIEHTIPKERLYQFYRECSKEIDYIQVEFNTNKLASFNIGTYDTLNKIHTVSKGLLFNDLRSIHKVLQNERIHKIHFRLKTNQELNIGNVSTISYSDNIYDILPKNINKKSILLEQLKEVDLKDVYIFADGVNDIPLFEIIPNRYYPTKAHHKIKEIGGKIYENLQEGIVQILMRES